MIVILKQFRYTLANVLQLHLMEYNGTGINSDHDFSIVSQCFSFSALKGKVDLLPRQIYFYLGGCSSFLNRVKEGHRHEKKITNQTSQNLRK